MRYVVTQPDLMHKSTIPVNRHKVMLVKDHISVSCVFSFDVRLVRRLFFV